MAVCGVQAEFLKNILNGRLALSAFGGPIAFCELERTMQIKVTNSWVSTAAQLHRPLCMQVVRTTIYIVVGIISKKENTRNYAAIKYLYEEEF